MSVLYEIDKQLERLLMMEDGNAVDTETGEVFTPEAIDELNMEWSQKVEGCLLFIKDQLAQAEAISKEENALSERRVACINRANRVKKYVQNILEEKKFETSKVAVSYRTSTKCEVHISPEELPEEFQRVTTKVEAMKKELSDYIKAGNKVNGVELVTEKKMSVK